MSDEIYHKLAKVLDTLPNGFPSTPGGAEIKMLKKIFTPEQAELFCDMRLTFETAPQVAERTGRPLEELDRQLKDMGKTGLLFSINFGGIRVFRMIPWVFGIYEFQLERLDKEFAQLNEEYAPYFGQQFFSQTPQLMRTLPVEKEISGQQEVISYEKVSDVIDANQSFLVNDCVCKKEKELLGQPCDRPMQVCLAMAPVAGVFDKSPIGKVLTKQEAHDLMKMTEEAGLVHLTYNVQGGGFYICNCCKCCCGVLRSINELGIPAPLVINSSYYAEIDADKCSSCGLCADERCQVGAIEEGDDAYHVIKNRCIGCGLCVSTCPSEAVRLVRKEKDQIVTPSVNEDAWFEERGRMRGVDFSRYK
ncbi:MAG: 4Fe-4S ferredoxin [Deltaproteobacteria bacterium HGW-Deltaproteobacteria-13]|jgi:NAD-dependent dihydropyrimidine dehydrogenase PreA subunit|nr:MAG: 4Fe-4S ferredoxin [Deltaproteobacteria bacterium HGW-Deltaproteobacteria-13]